MAPEIIIAIISGIVAVLVSLISKTEFFSRKHQGLMKDLVLLDSLPESSSRKDALLKYIDQRVDDYIKASTSHRRNGYEVAIGVIFLIIGGYLTWFFIDLGPFWLMGLVVSALLLLVGIYGTVRGFLKVERDEKGNPVAKKRPVSSE